MRTQPKNQPNQPEPNKVPKGLWQITVPFMTIAIFALGCITMIYMTNGKYYFGVDINHDGVKIQTDMDKTIPETMPKPNSQRNDELRCLDPAARTNQSLCDET